MHVQQKKKFLKWTRATLAPNWQSTLPDNVHFGFRVNLQEKTSFLPDDAFTL
jgi:hypothetical protein